MEEIKINNSDVPSMENETVDRQMLRFRVSAGLKRVLGRELITDDEVALFELVKNSFDANAGHVYLQFGDDNIVVADDGEGMSYEDLRNKWLFVAYSSKRDVNRKARPNNYRDRLVERQQYAGSKGIGRFSSDRLGQHLILQTKSLGDPSGVVHRLDINWADFEADDTRQFGQIDVSYRTESQFQLQQDVPDFGHGTVIEIRELAKHWTREELLRLRSGLAKLINPFGDDTDVFSITLVAERELINDDIARGKAAREDSDNLGDNALVVNGRVGNFIFKTLQEKTTFIDVEIDPATNTITSSLTDRGEVIYKIRELNPYAHLQNATFSCQLYFLNRAAKATFTRRVGLPAVQFGSVFLFRNDFRVFPIGESGDDWFGVDRRKQQGYARFLGTRDIIGRIDVSGSESMFQEASSRNQGLITTPAVADLRECFWEHCLKRLERYVIPVSWSIRGDVDTETLAYIETDSGRARVTAAVASLIGSEHVQVLQYSKRLIGTLNERSEQFEASLVNLKLIASTTGDASLAASVDEAETRFKQLKESEADARRIAYEERLAKEVAEARALAAVSEVEAVREELGEERKRNLFLASVTSLDTDTILDMHHLVTIYAADIQQQIENLMLRTSGKIDVPRELVINSLEPIALLNRKVLAVAKFATKASFRIDSEYIEEDLSNYIVSYIEDVARNFLGSRIVVDVTTDGKEFTRKFKPIDVSIVVDNLMNNSRKARASGVVFNLLKTRNNLLEIRVSDDGKGVPLHATTEGRMFEKGFTTTDGSGLGLYHVRQVIDEMGGSIELAENSSDGATFLIRIPECG